MIKNCCLEYLLFIQRIYHNNCGILFFQVHYVFGGKGNLTLPEVIGLVVFFVTPFFLPA